MNGRVVAGIVLALIFVVGSARTNWLYFAELLGSAMGIVLYLRAGGRRSRVRLWLASTAGAAIGGSFAVWGIGPDAGAIGEALGMAIFAGIPLAAAAELILTGKARIRRCPFCTKNIPVEAKVCRYCSRDVQQAVTTEGIA